MKNNFKAYRCPNCQMHLEHEENTWKCLNKHSFDIAKEGYVNLILANKKKSLNSGDSKEMIMAREQFLSLGYYDFLVEELLKLKLFEKKKVKLLEIGCGSGYYLNKIAEKISAEEVYGADVSKDAIKFCSKKYVDYSFSVNNSFDLNFESEFFEIIFSVFSPFKNDEVERVLAKGGYFILVRAGKGHLQELYPEVEMSEREKQSVEFKSLDLVETMDLEKKIKIEKSELDLLINMSPLVWKLDKAKIDLEKIKEITVKFKVAVYKNNLV